MTQYRFGFIPSDRELILTALSSHAHELYKKARELKEAGSPNHTTVYQHAARYEGLMLAIADGDCDLKEDV